MQLICQYFALQLVQISSFSSVLHLKILLYSNYFKSPIN